MSELPESNYQKLLVLNQDRVKYSIVFNELLESLLIEDSNLLKESNIVLLQLRKQVMEISWKLFITYSELNKLDENMVFQAFMPIDFTLELDHIAPIMVFPNGYDHYKITNIFKALGFLGTFAYADLDVMKRKYSYFTN